MKESITNLTKSEYAYHLIKKIGRKSYKQVIIKEKKNNTHYQVLYNNNISLSVREGSDVMYINFAFTNVRTQELIQLLKEIEAGLRINIDPNNYLPEDTQFNPTFFQTLKRRIHEFIRYCKNRKG